MKCLSYLTVGVFIILSGEIKAQIINPKEVIRNKGEQRTNSGVERGVDKGLDKLEEGIGNIFKKKDKSQPNTEAPSSSTSENQENTSESQSTETQQTSTDVKPAIKTNSKFDFEPGKKVLFEDNFERVAIGDFPADFNTNASGEVKSIGEKPGKWLSMTQNGFFIPENIKELPENFTLEFEVGIIGDPSNNYSGLGLNFSTTEENLYKDVMFSEGSSIVYLHPGADLASIQIIPSNGGIEINNDIKMPDWSINGNTFTKISIWRQKGRLRIYVGENKLVDMPRFFAENKPYQLAFFRRFFYDCEVLMTNIRYAVAGEDTRTKLLTDGKFVTNEILFDINSDKIKPESNKIISEIGNLLVENPNVKIKIIGHTDSDGDVAANLTLSKKRAESVKARLVYGFGIDENRLTTDGKGEGEPIRNNNTPEGKAQNRRVEFVVQK